MKRILLLSVLLISCGKDKDQIEPVPSLRLLELKESFEKNQARALELRDPATGWLSISDCDAMIWAGKYSCSLGEATTVNLRASEYPDQPGRFDRRPPPFCWTKELGDQGSKTTWSRDMGIAGLIPGAWCKKDLKLLEDHAAFGESTNWNMGEPLADGRAIYTPPIVGILYSTIKDLGGEISPKAKYPSVYFAGLDDYQAHLQMMDIWIKSDLRDEVSEIMLNRIDEHSKREAECPFYAFMKGKFSGDQSKTIDLLLASGEPKCSYVRSNEKEKSDLAEWLFVSKLVLDSFE